MKINLKELVDNHIINEETASLIESFYKSNTKERPNSLLLIFAIVGALLIGVGIILIITHNWEILPKRIKTIFAFIPLLVSQILVIYTLKKKSDNIVWKEASATALFFSIGACITLISQIYHIVGDLESFILIWMILAIPIIYLLHSKTVILFVLMGIYNYGIQTGIVWPRKTPWLYWMLMFSITPAMISAYYDKNHQNIFSFLLWGFVASITIILATFAINDEVHPVVLYYMSFFGILYLSGVYHREKEPSLIKNPLLCIGFTGMISVHLFTSFKAYWDRFDHMELFQNGLTSGITLWVSLTLLFIALFVHSWMKKLVQPFNIISVSPFLLILVYSLHVINPNLPVVFVNLFLFLIALYLLQQGIQKEDLRILNIGMLVLTAFIIARFFDVSIPFVLRGLIFIALGIGFFVANYLIIKKRNNEQE